MDVIAFSQNWNNKLNGQVFTTLRLRNDKKYYAGNRIEILLKGQSKGKAVVLEVKNILLEQINNYIAGIDTGLTAENCKIMIRQMYKNNPTIDWKNQHLSFVLLAYETRSKTLDLFDNESDE